MPSAATITAAALAWLSVTCTALVPSSQPYSAVRTGFAGRHQTRLWRHEVRLRSEETPTEPAAEESAEEAAPTEPERPKQFDLKAANTASAEKPFNQFDPVLSITGFISRRFGLVGGLAIVGALAATEGVEIVKGLADTGPQPGSGETITTASGLQYVDILVGTSGDSPKPGNIVGFNAVVTIGDVTLFDTYKDKPVAFKYGQRPFQNVVCDGLEEGVQGMKVGGKRKLIVNQELAPPGVKLPPGVPIIYTVELTEVLNSYL
uniref:peptidylprolyl isomerase n=1 Tax=Florenciella parvula TaxID=236787 RepID=A0A7S2GEU8_9STRA